jgi:hypothetical protein
MYVFSNDRHNALPALSVLSFLGLNILILVMPITVSGGHIYSADDEPIRFCSLALYSRAVRHTLYVYVSDISNNLTLTYIC